MVLVAGRRQGPQAEAGVVVAWTRIEADKTGCADRLDSKQRLKDGTEV